MNYFSDFPTGMMPQYDCVLLDGDFNIHVGTDKSLVNNFVSVFHSFNLVKCVSGPTNEHGQTLDLFPSHQLPVSSLEVCNSVFLDHMLALFEIIFSCTAVVAQRHFQLFHCQSIHCFV